MDSGSYLIREFAKNVVCIHAQSSRKLLSIELANGVSPGEC
ncbi:MAG TPA: hypothetical protein VGQ19_11065 [Burkholderiales bacterium]|nr:hypothetical protein [Burkholderiales bacterium]